MTTKNNTFEVETIVHVSPGSLLLTRNIREAKPDDALVKSIKDLGVLEPITAVITDEGALLVRTGHRRTLAAIAANRETVPVYISGSDSTETEGEIHRVIVQRDENTHRAGLTNAEDLAVVETLTGLGLSAAQVARRARIKRAHVDAALKVSGSKVARKATQRYDSLTLDQAAVVAEFEADPETVKALLVAALEGNFEHAAQRARNDRAEANAKAEVVASLIEAGVRVIDRPAHDSGPKQLNNLKASTDSAEPLSLQSHVECPGRVAWLGTEWVRVDADGNLIEFPDEPDEGADAAAWEAYETQCQHIRATSRQEQRPAPVYGCESPSKHGHVDRYSYGSTASSRPKVADMTEEEREAARKARAQVIESNKDWAAAETVRRDWLKTLAKIKTPPKGTAAFLATALCKDHSVANSAGGNALAAEWLGIKHTGYGWADLSPAKTATENHALVIVLLQVLGGYESGLTKDSWRRDGTTNDVGRYLRFLASCGYSLSAVEKFATNKTVA